MKIIDKIKKELEEENKKITSENIIKKLEKLSFEEREQYYKEFYPDCDDEDDEELTPEDILCMMDENDLHRLKNQ